MLVVPSPKKQTETSFWPLYCARQAAPQAIGRCAPMSEDDTVGSLGHAVLLWSTRCSQFADDAVLVRKVLKAALVNSPPLSLRTCWMTWPAAWCSFSARVL